MQRRNHIKLDFDTLAEAMAHDEVEQGQAYKANFLAAAFPLLIESLGSWQAFDAIGGFQAFNDAGANEIFEQLWLMVPLSRGGGGNTLQSEIAWNKLIADLRAEYKQLATTIREHINRKRLESLNES